MAEDLTAATLRDIRDGIQDLRADTNARLDALREAFGQRLDQINDCLERAERGLNDLRKFMRQLALDQAKHERLPRSRL